MYPSAIPVVDLFAGPGGLGEGFSSLDRPDGGRSFEIRVSIEKDVTAHRTLSLRALFRAFGPGRVPDCYYDYVRGNITRDDLFGHPAVRAEAEQALIEARCAELGVEAHETIDDWIRPKLGNVSDWVLIGGPPCQAYSMAGRSRLRGKDPEAFENDSRHLLYKEYLRTIRCFRPSVFVMENVKGILTSRLAGAGIFKQIIGDLSEPGEGLTYQIRSLVVAGSSLNPADYVIESEKFGIPQCRHRVILFGVRSDLAARTPALFRDPGRFTLRPAEGRVSVGTALKGLPALRSRISRVEDTRQNWLTALSEASRCLEGWREDIRLKVQNSMKEAHVGASAHTSAGKAFEALAWEPMTEMPGPFRNWILDSRLGGVIQHETRRHMESDLRRYLFAASFASAMGHSPNLSLYPPALLPAHRNMEAETIPFMDRFRVQVADQPASTIVSHIAKDGHYYIHPDPSQCRSLTVREAARLQTFPDNYFFEGNRTQQYHQVGNAVPPLLAVQIARVVQDLIRSPRY